MKGGHWSWTAEYVTTGDTRILGEDEHGDWWVPSRFTPGWWDRKFNPRDPRHWPYWLRSRLSRRIAFLEVRS